MTNNDSIEDTLYNGNRKIYSLISNEVDELQDSFTETEWCPPQEFSSPIEGMGSIAGFVPDALSSLPTRQTDIPEKFMRFYSRPVKGSPEIVPAIYALHTNPAEAGVDYRPHLFDASLKKHLLLDSGSAVTAFPPEPGDVEQPGMTLKAVNGTKIKCFGTKQVDVKIGRKNYRFQAIIAQVQSPILGWDFFQAPQT